MKYTKIIVVSILATAVAGLIYVNVGSKEDIVTPEEPIVQLTNNTPPSDNRTQQEVVALEIEARLGDAPEVTSGIPHIQLDQTSDDSIYEELVAQVYAIEGIVGGESQSSLPGAQSMAVAPGLPFNQNAKITGREFAHIHANPGRGSLHLVLPVADAMEVVEMGWGVYHPFALNGTIPGMVMVFAPRDNHDLKTVVDIVSASFAFAGQQ